MTTRTKLISSRDETRRTSHGSMDTTAPYCGLHEGVNPPPEPQSEDSKTPCSITLSTTGEETRRERSKSANESAIRLPLDSSSKYLSPSRIAASSSSSNKPRKNQFTYRKNSSSSLAPLDEVISRRRSSSVQQGSPGSDRYRNGWKPSTPFLFGAGVRRSTSSSTLRLHRTQYGSDQHLGSSVTFCQTTPTFTQQRGRVDDRRSSCTSMFSGDHIGNGMITAQRRLSRASFSVVPTPRPRSDTHDGVRTIRSALPEISIDGTVLPRKLSTGSEWGDTVDRGLLNMRRYSSSYHLQAGVTSKAVMITPRGSFLAVNQSPLEFRESTLSINYPDYLLDDGEEVSLVYARLEKIPMKDFAAEIRAHLDVEHFLSQAQLILDLQESNMEDILDTMLHHLLDKDESPAAYIEASKVLFTHDSVHQLSKTIQCTCSTYGGGYDYDQSWICVLCTVSSVQKRHVAIARLRTPANLGRTSQEVWFIILVITSTKEKGTKNALETGRTFATLFADMDLRLQLLGARTETEFKELMWQHMKDLAAEQCEYKNRRQLSIESGATKEQLTKQTSGSRISWLGRGLREDWNRRIPHYISDYKDGFRGANTVHKMISTTFFLYFACILPAIALGVLNYNNTGGLVEEYGEEGKPYNSRGRRGQGHIDVKKVIYSQTIGGLFFAIFGGQPMVILLTTAPLAIYTKVIYKICELGNMDFVGMFCCTGLWNSFFLLIYALTDASKLMKWCTRSTEEIFALFISIAFAVDAFRDVAYDFQENYYSPACSKGEGTGGNGTGGEGVEGKEGDCMRENSLLYLLMVLGTVWLGLSLYNFTKTPFLNASKRELLADCALPVAVLVMSFFGSYIFRDVKLKQFELLEEDIFRLAPLHKLHWTHILVSLGLGFCLSLLFFLDQNIAAVMANSPDNRMKKGPAYHWDLMIIAVLNAFLSLFGLPMVHGALPHTPLHVRAMADAEDRVFQGHVYLKIVSVRETRVTAIFSHILIGLSLLLIEQLKKIPRPVLDGLFLYLAITALHNNQLFERIMLLVTEQAAYPPNHYIRTVPQRKIHLFTLLQLLQLAVLCGFGFASSPYLKMVFPVLHLVMLPIRHKLVPHLIEKKYLQSLDGHK